VSSDTCKVCEASYIVFKHEHWRRFMESSFIILATMLAIFAILGIIEAQLLHPVFYSNSAVIFGILGYFTYRQIREK